MPGASTEINLSLITSLLPQRYPQSIDINTMEDKDGNRAFRSYTMAIDTGNDTACLSKEYRHNEVLVVHFEGQVGAGNRSIRSDEPFPEKCHKVSSSATVTLSSVSCSLKKQIRRAKTGMNTKNSISKLNQSWSSLHSAGGALPLSSSTSTKNSFGNKRSEAAQCQCDAI